MTTAFAPKTVNDAIENFDGLLHTKIISEPETPADKIEGKFKRITASLPKILPERGIGDFLKKRAIAQDQIAREFFRAKMMQFLPALDESIFDLSRHITVQTIGNKTSVFADSVRGAHLPKAKNNQPKSSTKVIETELFIYAGIKDAGKSVEIGKYKTVTTNNWGDQYRRTVTITAKVPNLDNPEFDALQRHAASALYLTMSELLRHEQMGPYFAAHAEKIKPEFGIAWIPATGALSVKSDTKVFPAPRRDDPALLMEVFGHNYVVATWDIKEEEPYEQYIREFSEGNLSGVIRSKQKK